MKDCLLVSALLLGISSAALPQSVMSARLDDPRAVYVSAAADGKADDSAAIQAAIDKAENHAREGIVFVPPGRYRLTRTIYIWPGVRIFGYGATRPVFLLANNTPGFQKGVGRDGDIYRCASG